MIWSKKKLVNIAEVGHLYLGFLLCSKNKYNHNNPSKNNKENTQRERERERERERFSFINCMVFCSIAFYWMSSAL